MTKQVFFSFLTLLFLASCAGTGKMSRSAASYNNYSEDLSSYRPSFPEIPQARAIPEEVPVSAGSGTPVDKDLEFALEKFTQENASKDYFNGFTILVYSGVDREHAFDTRNQLYSSLSSNFKAEMEYQQPRYLVKVGRFLNRIEAQALFHSIKKEFPSARIIQQRFERQKGDQEGEEEEI
ncbi:hypothetical protein QWY93_08135 [Echinicola jeungdonensis]|uniref:SPOR domain-containing protein n=1 Tax=Echinicola jeungdonensis TaxID=709343 RepID=A0ABV5J8E1_9BACT|nr:hypothetical protein [Echinicola jeungdonensis]MDN3669294.1 hypothetical protein [Echinicola jeungdonensis]